MILIECKRQRHHRKPRLYNRWWVILLVALAIPGSLFAAYEPAFVLPARLINTTAPVTGGGDLSADRTIAVSDCTATVRGAVPTPPNNTTTFLRGDCTFAAPASAFSAPTVTNYTSNTATVTLAATNNLQEVIAQGAPAALAVTLNATGLSAGYTQCVKDKANTAATNNITVKTSDTSTIDSVAGSTGFVMNQTKQFNCFVFDGGSPGNWMIE